MSPIERDDLPQELAGDPSHPRRLIVFVGMVGDSHTEGFLRLYLDEELREWFDVAEGDIVHAERRNVSLGPRTILWVDERTTLQVRQAQAQDVHGEYLDGNVAAVTVPQTAAFVALDWSYSLRTPIKVARESYSTSSPDTSGARQS
jgi:hypothetical protein